MRQSLERLGGSRPIERPTSLLANRPRRHAFVQDGQVVVEQARRRQRGEPGGAAMPLPEAGTAPEPSLALSARVEQAERALGEARALARGLQTRLGHLQLELEDATRRLGEHEATILRLRQDEAQAGRVREALGAELDGLRRQQRSETPPADAAPDAGEAEPVKWWLPTLQREARPRRG